MANVKIMLRKTCLDCPELDVRDSIDHLYSGDDVFMSFGLIYCSHMKVCKLVKDQPTIDSLLNKAKE